jgi:hypothetical protein
LGLCETCPMTAARCNKFLERFTESPLSNVQATSM